MGTPLRVVIIPAFNEGASIGRVVSAVKPFALPLVVDDGSKDETALVAEQAGAHVVRQRNRGYESALDRGFQEAARLKALWALTLDADGQHDPEMIPAFFAPLEKDEADLVIGIRPHFARISEKILSLYFRLRFGVQDPLCGMKAYRLSDYLDYGAFDSSHSVGMELAHHLLRKGVRTHQIPIPIHDREHGTPRFGRVLRANWRILRCLWSLQIADPARSSKTDATNQA